MHPSHSAEGRERTCLCTCERLDTKVRSVRAQIRLGTLRQMFLPCAGKIGVYMISSGYRPDYSGIAVHDSSEVA